jgi:hypothetical protein
MDGPGDGRGARGGDGRGPRGSAAPPPPPDTRAPTTISLTLLEPDARRGAAFHVRGKLVSDGDPCPDTPVVIALYSRAGVTPIGTVATDEKGAFDASITLLTTITPGEYDVRAYTQGSSRCGPGSGQ